MDHIPSTRSVMTPFPYSLSPKIHSKAPSGRIDLVPSGPYMTRGSLQWSITRSNRRTSIHERKQNGFQYALGGFVDGPEYPSRLAQLNIVRFVEREAQVEHPFRWLALPLYASYCSTGDALRSQDDTPDLFAADESW